MSKPLVHRFVEATAPEVDRVLRRSRRTALKGIRRSVRDLDPVGMLVHGAVAALSQVALDRKRPDVTAGNSSPKPDARGDVVDVEYRVIDVTPKH